MLLFPRGGGDSHIKVMGMLNGKLKLTPLRKTNVGVAKLKLTPKGDFCVVSITAFLALNNI